MNNEVYINRVAVYLPNNPISNDEIEDYLGRINGKPSKSKRIVLGRNKIVARYYAIDKAGNPTHSNAEMTALAVRGLFTKNESELKDIDLLSCGTSSPDQLIPSHGVMVHGILPETSNIEVMTTAGVCCSGMHALKYAFMSLKLGDKSKAVTTGSEKLSSSFLSENYEEEIQKLTELGENPYIGFEKDFLRWMLSDGAGAFLLETNKNNDSISLRIDWIETCSFAHQFEVCMYMGAEKLADGSLKSYRDYEPSELVNQSLLSIKQDVKLLSKNIVSLGNEFLLSLLKKHNIDIKNLTYFLPHLSSYVFKQAIADSLVATGLDIPEEKWFTNLATAGNVGSGSIYIMVEELFNSGKLKKGDTLLLMVPESARFSYVFTWLTVC